MVNQLKVGTAVRDITPGYPVWLAGYANRVHRSTGVAEPLSLRCLAIGDEQKTILLITLDLIGLSTQMCTHIYDQLQRQVGIGFPDIMIACSHTHFAPVPETFVRGAAVVLGGSTVTQHVATDAPMPPEDVSDADLGLVDPDPRFVDDLMEKVVQAARDSLAAMQPGVVEEARIQVPQVVFNRRTIRRDGTVETNFLYPDNPQAYRFTPTDTELTVLRVCGEQGMLAVVANFGCHPVTGGHPQAIAHYRISADYPAYLRQVVENAYHCPVFFTLGAAGDAVPINRMGDCRQQIGSILGNSILLAERKFQPLNTPALSTGFETITAKTSLTTQPETAAHDYAVAKSAFLALLREKADRENSELQASADRFDTAAGALARASMYPENEYPIRLQIVRIGPLVLVGFPFEVFSDLGLELKQAYPRSVLLSCTGGYQGYLPSGTAQGTGGYEVSVESNHFAPDTGDRLLAAAKQHLASGS